MSFDAKKQNQLIIKKRSELAKEHREMMAAQLAERDAAYKLSVARAKGGRRTKRHKHSNKKKRMSRRR